jgi:hypothetical protein
MADVDKIPIKYGQYLTYSSGEGNEYAYGYYYDDPKTGEPVGVSQDKIKDFKKSEVVWDPNLISFDGEGGSVAGGYRQTDPSGYIEIPKPLARHRRDQLNQSVQKVYDQLVDQRDRIAAVDSNAANKLYGPHSDLTADEGMVLMAQELAESGITDIYKVKKETVTDRLPIEYGEIGSSGEGGGTYGYFYRDQFGSPVQVAQNQIKDFSPAYSDIGEGGGTSAPASGFVEVPRTQYLNTETNQPLAIDQYGQYAGQENILQSRGAADRVKIGYGINFTDEGIPTYFQTAYKEPSSWKRFTNTIRPILPLAAMLIPGIGQALAPLANTLIGAVGATATPALTAAVSQGLASGIANTVATGDIGKGILSGLGSGTLSYLMAPSFNTPSPDDFAAMEAAGYQAGNIDDLFSGSGATLPDVAFPEIFAPPTLPPGEAGIQQILSEAAGAPTPEFDITDVVPTNVAPQPEFDITDVVPTNVAPQPEFDITDVVPTNVAPQPEFDPASALETQVAPPGAPPPPDPTLGDPTAAPGGMPKLSVGDQLAIAGMTAGGSLAAFAATPAGRLALAIGGPMLLEKVFGDKQAGGAGAGTAGWSGTIPEYQMVRERVPLADAGRRPGEYGRRYFSDTSFVPLTPGAENAEANLGLIQQAQQAAQAQAAGLAALPPGVAERRAAPTPTVRYQTVPERTTAPSAGLPAIPTYIQEPRLSYGLPTPDERLEATNFRTPEERKLRLASGGLASLAKGRYLDGPTDGMEDKLKTTIEGEQPARLSHGEFVIPADVVSHLGNGNSQAGAKRLYDMMDKIRHARTGSKKQGRQINPDKYLPS